MQGASLHNDAAYHALMVGTDILVPPLGCRFPGPSLSGSNLLRVEVARSRDGVWNEVRIGPDDRISASHGNDRRIELEALHGHLVAGRGDVRGNRCSNGDAERPSEKTQMKCHIAP